MKKKDKELTKVSMFYNTEAIVIGGLCFVGYLGMTDDGIYLRCTDLS